MICYRDMTFCESDCINRLCSRNFNENDAAAARIWWGGDDAPVAFADFSKDCAEYRGPSE